MYNFVRDFTRAYKRWWGAYRYVRGGGGGAVWVSQLCYKGGGRITGLKKVFQNKVQCT